MRFSTAVAALCLGLALTGCASKPKPAPEPDMSELVIINKTLPAELVGQPGVALPKAKKEGSE
jgi:hypothetical protein